MSSFDKKIDDRLKRLEDKMENTPDHEENSQKPSKKNSADIMFLTFGKPGIAILLMIALFFIGFGNILNFIGDFIATLFTFDIPGIGINLNSLIGEEFKSVIGIILTISIFVVLVTTLFKSKRTGETIQKEITWAVVLILIVGVVGGVYNNWYTTTKTVEEKAQETEQTAKSGLFGCMISTFSSKKTIEECIREENTKNTAKTSQKSEYSISFTPPGYNQFTPQDLEQPLMLDYKFKSTGDLYVKNLLCYINKKEDENLFYNKSIDREILTGGEETFVEGFSCENVKEAVKERQEEKREEFDIIPVIQLKLHTKYSLEIPIISYEELLKEEGLSRDNSYSYIRLKEKLNKYSKDDKEFWQSNDGLEVQTSILEEKLPLLYGDGEERNLGFPIKIKENPSTDFGDFKAGKITDVSLPVSLSFQEGEKESIKKKISLKDGDIYTQRIRLKENEMAFDLGENLKAVQTMTIDMETDFERSDRFEIVVLDENFNEENSSSQ